MIDGKNFSDLEMRVLYRMKKLNEHSPTLQARYVGHLHHQYVVSIRISVRYIGFGDDIVIDFDGSFFPMLRKRVFKISCIRLTFDEDKIIESVVLDFYCGTNPIYDIEASEKVGKIMLMPDEKVRAYVEGDIDGK